jgi:hypothetical protein
MVTNICDNSESDRVLKAPDQNSGAKGKTRGISYILMTIWGIKAARHKTNKQAMVGKVEEGSQVLVERAQQRLMNCLSLVKVSRQS